MFMSIAELDEWFHDLDPEKFPYEVIVREFHSGGKHFVSHELLAALARARTLLPQLNSPWPDVQILSSFLDTALDKPDGRYDYQTYLALSLLQLPDVDDPIEQTPFTRSRCDRLIVQLAADALHFELQAADGHSILLPDMRPAPEATAKRYRQALRAIRPALARQSLDGRVTETDPEAAARQACAVVRSDMSLIERLTLVVTILPVYTMHDEYMFLRVLQMFETTFALLAVQLRAACAALADHDVGRALHFLKTAEQALRESAPLFSMLATMQAESFRVFREFTDGASAIQSSNYKFVESVCREPDRERVDSAAYRSVPKVRERVLAGQPTLDDAFERARTSGELTDGECGQLGTAMQEFAAALLRWRKTHYSVAIRMLGDKPGTGYTQGTPYLAAGRLTPVFRSSAEQENGELVTV
jgi:tryptophan 2,3-dioxygenase